MAFCRAAIDEGSLDARRLASLETLVAEEAAVEAEQERRERIADRRRAPRGGVTDDNDIDDVDDDDHDVTNGPVDP